MGKAVNLVRDTNDEDCPTPCRPGVSFANFLLKNSSPSSAPMLCDYAMRLKPKRAGPLFTRIFVVSGGVPPKNPANCRRVRHQKETDK